MLVKQAINCNSNGASRFIYFNLKFGAIFTRSQIISGPTRNQIWRGEKPSSSHQIWRSLLGGKLFPPLVNGAAKLSNGFTDSGGKVSKVHPLTLGGESFKLGHRRAVSCLHQMRRLCFYLQKNTCRSFRCSKIFSMTNFRLWQPLRRRHPFPGELSKVFIFSLKNSPILRFPIRKFYDFRRKISGPTIFLEITRATARRGSPIPEFSDQKF